MVARVRASWAAPLLALLLMIAGTALAEPPKSSAGKTRPVCCANHPASHAKCCSTGKKEACCHGGKPAKGVTAVCAVTGKPLRECCGSKASQMPPCCQKDCKEAGKTR